MTEIWVNIGCGNGLLTRGTKPLPVDWSSQGFCGIHPTSISPEVLMDLICNMSLEITLLKLPSHLPGANELNPNNKTIELTGQH